MAFFTGRLWIKWAFAQLLGCIANKGSALFAEILLLPVLASKGQYLSVSCLAVDLDETYQHHQVFLLFMGQLFHVLHDIIKWVPVI